jgi:hypothetical protein
MANILREALEKARQHYILKITRTFPALHSSAELSQLPLTELQEIWKKENLPNK